MLGRLTLGIVLFAMCAVLAARFAMAGELWWALGLFALGMVGYSVALVERTAQARGKVLDWDDPATQRAVIETIRQAARRGITP